MIDVTIPWIQARIVKVGKGNPEERLQQHTAELTVDRPVLQAKLTMTHMRWCHGQRSRRAGTTFRLWSFASGGLREWSIGTYSIKDKDTIQSETPTPCECEQANT